MSADLYSYCWFNLIIIAGLISSLDWPSKTTPNWLLTSWNPPISSQVTVISSSCQLICTAIMLIWPHHSLGLQKLIDMIVIKYCHLWLSSSTIVITDHHKQFSSTIIIKHCRQALSSTNVINHHQQPLSST